MEMDNSFLYKNQNLHDQPFLRPLTMNLVVQIDDFVKKVKKSNEVEAKDEEEPFKIFIIISEYYGILYCFTISA